MLLPLPCVCQMMPPSALAYMLLRGFDGEILVGARQLFDAPVEQHEIVHQFEQTLFIAHLQQVFIQLQAGIVLLVLFPGQEILLLVCQSCRSAALRNRCPRRRTAPC